MTRNTPLSFVSWQMYCAPGTDPGRDEEQRFTIGANLLPSLDHTMNFEQPRVFPMQNLGLQEGVQLYNSTGGISLLSKIFYG
jgi:hypothetical protein